MWLHLACLLLFSNLSLAQHQITLHVEIEGVESAKGVMVVSVYRAEDDFPRKSSFRTVRVSAKAPKTHCSIDLPPGRYAVAVYHDKDENGQANKNFLGIPTEGVGVSNDAIKGISRPEFEDAAFNLEKEMNILVKMHHY